MKKAFAEAPYKSVIYGDIATQTAKLDDCAHYLEALLSLAGKAVWAGQAEQYSKWMQRSVEIAHYIENTFKDPREVGHYFSEAMESTVEIPTKKVWFDNATPSGNASLLHSFSVLAALYPEADYGDKFSNLKIAYAGTAENLANAQGHAFSGIVQGATGIAVLKVAFCTGSRRFICRHSWENFS